jgi:hypothetical protein
MADSNWLVAAYVTGQNPVRTEVVRRFTARMDVPIWLSLVVELECQNIFAALGQEPKGEEWCQFQADIGTKLLVTEIGWNSLVEKSRELFQRFSHKARLGTLDTMILASALKAEATHFLSFDTNSNTRALAAVLKLKVFPALTAEDRRRMAAFR